MLLVHAASNKDSEAIEVISSNGSKVEFGTLHWYDPQGTIHDVHHKLFLVETGEDTSTFVSESQLLVVDDSAEQQLHPPHEMDDEFAVYSPYVGATVPDNDPNDRTHRVRLDGGAEAVFKMEGCASARRVMRPVSEQRRDLAPPHDPHPDGIREVLVRIRVHLEPFQDTGYTHVQDGEEFEINTNHHIKEDDKGYYYDRGQTGQRDADDWAILHQAGTPWDWNTWKVSVDLDGNGEHDPGEPVCDRGFDFQDLDGNLRHDHGERSEEFRDLSSFEPLAAVPDWLRGHEEDAGSWGKVTGHAHINRQLAKANLSWAQAGIRIVQIGDVIEHPSGGLLHDGWFPPGAITDWIRFLQPAPAATPDIAEVLFTAPIQLGQINGLARIPRTWTEIGDPPYPDEAENSYAFISCWLPVDNRTVAHELGHLLTNRGDPDAPVVVPDYMFFPSQGWTTDEQRTTYRRLYHQHKAGEKNARTERPAGNLTAPGSRLLRVPGE